MRKEVQSLNGKLVALYRFLSKATERSLPFFKVLKDNVGRNFDWTPEADHAFQEMKALIRTLPKLTAPVPGETLTIYLAAGTEAVSSVLVAERGGIQMPVYFVSKVLQHDEVNYKPIKKLIFALVQTARRLRRYFQAHPMLVLTDSPIKQVLSKPEVVGRLAKWAIELGEHEIHYAPRTAVKGQIMEVFMVEFKCAAPLAPVVEEVSNIITWELFTDEASSSEGAGAGLILIGPDGEEHTYALRFKFPASNNEAEYEALLSGLRMAEKMGIKCLKVSVDSQLVANQMNGMFEARDPAMQNYLALAEEMANKFERFSITQVPRSLNKKADALSKLASSVFSHFTKDVLVEVLTQKSTDVVQEAAPVEEVETWMSPIVTYLKNRMLPFDGATPRKIRMKAPVYMLRDGVMFKKSFTAPLLRCVGPSEAETIVREVHEGTCGMHAGFRTVVGKIMRLGYFWPSMYRDTKEIIKAYASCQRYAPQIHMPAHELIPVMFAWPFYKWEIDLVGPFPDGKHLVVAIDFFTKWVEAKPLKSITGIQIVNFVWEKIVCCFGIPHENVNGQVEVTNRDIVAGIRARLDTDRKGWADELPQVLWAFRTTPKGSNRETPFSLIYGTEAVIPAEIVVPTQRVVQFNDESNVISLKENLDLLEEMRNAAAIREASNKQKIAKYYN
ncbi:uncharacterized protein [Rutidosis leptorrhynchoides]|uniref:uncharacterized protein n=1 Tax=Rutidosis leptorrhynchoides TaxID=125765 RepID=UPI003A99EF27